MKYAQIRQYDVANGKGIGCTLFVSGCTHNCKGCFNKEYQDFDYGQLWNKRTEEQFIEMCKNPHVDHINLLGGEVLQQQPFTDVYRLLERLHNEVKKPIWLWTGYVYGYDLPPFKRDMIHQFVDVLIDGRFIESEKDLTLQYRGSKNQRVINVKETLKQNKIVLWED